MSRFDVIGFGALNVDKLFRVNKIAAAEEESFVLGFDQNCGGSAANVVAGLAKLDCRVGFIGKIANDPEGKILLDDLSSRKIDTQGVRMTSQGRSGTVMGFVDMKGQRALYVDAGVNDEISSREMDCQYACQAEYLHLTSFVGKKSFQAQKGLVRDLSENIRFSFDPGAIYAALGPQTLSPILSKSYVVMPNRREIEQLTGKKDYRKGAEVLLRKGVKIVAVKLGPKGSFVTDGTERHLIKPFPVKVIDTTGAGDAFCAGFLYGLIKKKGLSDCGRLGNFVASRCITQVGARTELPTIKDLRENGMI